jgi:hypothetical protein
MTDARELAGALRFFREISGLAQEPAHDRHHRLALLRVVYALAPHNVPQMLAALAHAGVELGAYNEAAVRSGMKEHLFDMTPAAWCVLLSHLRVDSCGEVLRMIEKHYGAEHEASPVLRFRAFVRNAAAHRFDEEAGEHLALFLHTYNTEVRASELLSQLLPRLGVCNVPEVVYALNDRHVGFSQDKMIFDLVCILGNTSADSTRPLLAGMQASEQQRHEELSVGQQLSRARTSIRTLRENLRRAETTHTAQRKSELSAPPGLPIETAEWTRLSQSQRQVVLLVCLARPDAVDDVPARLACALPAELAEPFTAYEFPAARHLQALEAALPALQRFAHVVEFANARVGSVLQAFQDNCLGLVLGEEQKLLMPVATLAQVYMLAHFAPALQAVAYRHVAAAFNANIPAARKNLRIGENLSADLCDRMTMYTSEHKLSPEFAEGVLKRLCV